MSDDRSSQAGDEQGPSEEGFSLLRLALLPLALALVVFSQSDAGTGGPKKPRGFKHRRYMARWILIAYAPVIILVGLLPFGLAPSWELVDKLGVLQPTIAAFLALLLVLSARATLGRFANDRRKGVISASSAAIAVRLWALCFAMLVGAMLLSALVARLPEDLLLRTEATPTAEANSVGAPPAVKASVEVTR